MPVEITPALVIPDSELRVSASRSSGPGGQNVNKVNSKVTVEFSLDDSLILDASQKERIRLRLPTRIDSHGMIRVSSQRSRSQHANRQEALERLGSLLARALEEQRVRRKTKVSKAARARRLEEKRKRSEQKKARSKPAE